MKASEGAVIRFRCDYCGRFLDDPVEPYHIEWIGLTQNAYHTRCLNTQLGYVQMKGMHDAWCHLPDCPHGPTDPFARDKTWP